MSATPHLDRLLDIAHKTRQANNIVRFDDAVWITGHLFDIEREVKALQMAEIPAENFAAIAGNLVTQMDVMLSKCRGVASMKTRITELENQLAGIA
jgi:hypothetical protein